MRHGKNSGYNCFDDLTWRVAIALEFAALTNAAGAPLFAHFAKGGYNERLHLRGIMRGQTDHTLSLWCQALSSVLRLTQALRRPIMDHRGRWLRRLMKDEDNRTTPLGADGGEMHR